MSYVCKILSTVPHTQQKYVHVFVCVSMKFIAVVGVEVF